MDIERRNRVEDALEVVHRATDHLNGSDFTDVIADLIAERIYDAVSYTDGTLSIDTDSNPLINKVMELLSCETRARIIEKKREDEING